MMDTITPARLPVIMERNDNFFSMAFRRRGCIFCSGMIDLLRSDCNSVGAPNSPANAGNKMEVGKPIGEEIGTVRIIIPKMPERKKTKQANNIPRSDEKEHCCITPDICAFSVAIIRMTIAIRTQTIAS